MTKMPERKVKEVLRAVVEEHAGKRTLAPNKTGDPSIDDALDEFETEDE
jgi:hypothetical protein